jgi:hypothetical protein
MRPSPDLDMAFGVDLNRMQQQELSRSSPELSPGLDSISGRIDQDGRIDVLLDAGSHIAASPRRLPLL